MNKRDQELWEQALHDGERFDSAESCFADLIRADEREACANAVVQAVEKGLQAAMALEREACAKVCDAFQARDVGMQPAECAGAIRARGNT